MNCETLCNDFETLHQKFTLYNDLTVEENLLFHGRGYGLHGERLKARINYALDMAGLKGREHDMPPKLSGGWRQCLALGAAIIYEPDIVFLDEPTTGVDPLSRRAFGDLLYVISAQGTTVFVTTHYMDEAEHCENLAFIYRGQIIAEGAPASIKAQHAPGEIVQITPTNAQAAMQTLTKAYQANLLGGMSINLYGAQIHILTRDSGTTYRRALQALKDAGEDHIDADIIPPSLEDAFIRLLDEQKQLA